jgi:predicted GIY-YIG superfamily endonuclease
MSNSEEFQGVAESVGRSQSAIFGRDEVSYENQGFVESGKACYVYLLVSTSGTTYVGATIELDRRLRQHNKEIKGGAHATSMKVNKGETWRRHCYVSGFPDWQGALQFEWRWKQLSRKLPPKMNPLERRMSALDTLLALERPTTKARAYSEWPSPPEIHYIKELRSLKELRSP